jgi:hypothetical protein
MKNILKISFTVTLFTAFTFVSCMKDSMSGMNGGTTTNGVEFKNLTVEKSTLDKGATTKLSAITEMHCMCKCGTNYTWTTNAGTISGNGAEVVLNAPTTAASVQITCSVSHCCNEHVMSKSMNITVQ